MKKKWIFWGEDIEQTQLRTVCKAAVAKAKKENGERPRQRSQHQSIFLFTACQITPLQRPINLKQMKKLEKLREIFQAAS